MSAGKLICSSSKLQFKHACGLYSSHSCACLCIHSLKRRYTVREMEQATALLNVADLMLRVTQGSIASSLEVVQPYNRDTHVCILTTV